MRAARRGARGSYHEDLKIVFLFSRFENVHNFEEVIMKVSNSKECGLLCSRIGRSNIFPRGEQENRRRDEDGTQRP